MTATKTQGSPAQVVCLLIRLKKKSPSSAIFFSHQVERDTYREKEERYTLVSFPSLMVDMWRNFPNEMKVRIVSFSSSWYSIRASGRARLIVPQELHPALSCGDCDMVILKLLHLLVGFVNDWMSILSLFSPLRPYSIIKTSHSPSFRVIASVYDTR